ncbi:MAG: SprT-like domain-containing protein [Bryobacteraceae bacterium]
MCARVFRQLRPRTPVPEISVRFLPYADAHSSACWQNGRIELRFSDVLLKAPPEVLEALAWILLGKLLRRPVPSACLRRYRQYLNRSDVQRSIELIRRLRGRKQFCGPRGRHYDLEEIFDALNQRFFGGLMIRPQLGWSLKESRTTLGHWDPAHRAIVISRLLDRPGTPRLAVEYVLFHEMLHLRHPTQTRGTRRRIHTAEFRAAERSFPRLEEAKQILKRLVQS